MYVPQGHKLQRLEPPLDTAVVGPAEHKSMVAAIPLKASC